MGLPERHTSEPPCMSKTCQLSECSCPQGHPDVCVGMCDFHKQTDSSPFPGHLCQLGPECLLSTFPCSRSLPGPQEEGNGLPSHSQRSTKGPRGPARLVSQPGGRPGGTAPTPTPGSLHTQLQRRGVSPIQWKQDIPRLLPSLFFGFRLQRINIYFTLRYFTAALGIITDGPDLRNTVVGNLSPRLEMGQRRLPIPPIFSLRFTEK